MNQSEKLFGQFYDQTLPKGYKKCECLYCKQLLNPCCIKVERNKEEFEDLHKYVFDDLKRRYRKEQLEGEILRNNCIVLS